MKFNKILTVLSGAFLLCGAYACTDEVEYNPAPAVTGDEVYFSNDESADVAIGLDATSVSINLNRYKTEGDLTVGLTSSVTDADGNPVAGIFSVPTEVVFPDGADVVPIEVGLVFSDIVPEKDYMLTLTINGEDTTPYGLVRRTFALSYAPWSDWEPYSKTEPATFTFTTIWNGYFNDIVYQRASLTNSNLEQFMMFDPWSDPSTGDVLFEIIVTLDKSKTLTIDGETCYQATVTPFNTGEQDGDGYYLWITDAYSYLKQLFPDYTDAEIANVMAKNDWGNSYYSPSTGLFTLFVVPFNQEGGYYPKNTGYYYMQLPGFKSYYIEFNTNGNYVDKTGMEYVIISAIHSEDVASYAYTIKQGVLSDDEVKATAEELAADTEVELVYDLTTTLKFALDEEGDYTIVAVGYDESGAQVCISSYTFTFESVMKESDWADAGYVEYTDGFFYGLIDIEGFEALTMECPVQEHKEIPGYYRLVNPYAEWAYNNSDWFLFSPGNWYMLVNASDPTAVVLETSAIGYEEDGQMMYVSSMAYLNMSIAGATLAQVKAAGMTGTFKNGSITFPTKQLFLSFGIEGTQTGQGYYGNIGGSFRIDFADSAETARISSRKSIASKAVGAMSIDKNRNKVNLKLTRRSASVDDKTIRESFNSKMNTSIR